MNEDARMVTLPREVVERIAAGEVILRPASVVRELTENALDAGASTIRVELRTGGLRLIRVHDNGCGIAAKDIPLAGLAHTTSKVHQLADLDHIVTLGFRGEALASIATVAELEIASASDAEGVAAVYTRHLDSGPHTSTQARSRGTTVTVRWLFQSMPARLSFLGSARSEATRAQALVRSYALAYPGVAFTLVSDGELVLHTPGTNTEDAVASLYGADVARGILPFETHLENGTTSISGIVTGRSFHQAGRELVFVLVNGRLLASRALLAAAEAGYRRLLPKGRHPLLVARILMPPDQVDVNVHPAKAEVLLQGEAEIVLALRTSIYATLGASPVSVASPNIYGGSPRTPIQLSLPSPRKRRGLRVTKRPQHAYSTIVRDDDLVTGTLPVLEPLAQFDDALILTRSVDGDLFLVDQHRAHERILYERLLHQREILYREGEVSSGQLLLEPLLIELTPTQATLLTPRIAELSALGLVCQPFGGSVFLVRSVPYLAGAAEAPFDLAKTLATAAAAASDDWMTEVSIALACQTAIRRGRALTEIEQRKLLSELQQVKIPGLCPHGSPLLLRYSKSYLTRTFEW